MSTRRRDRGEDTVPQSGRRERRGASRTSALRKSRQEQQTRTTIVIVAMAVLCIPLVLWIYPKITSGTVVSRLASAQMDVRSTTAAQITGVRRSHEAAGDGTYAVRVSCEVYNGTTNRVSGVVVALMARDDAGGTVKESTGRPADFALDPRASQHVEVSLAGLTEQQIGRIAFLRLASRFAN